MPASINSRHHHLELNTKETPVELHEKLASIIERFEETRLAIRENVKMLEAIQDTSATIDAVYPASSLSMAQKSEAAQPHTSSDMTLGRGNSLGLRTISSIDSGVMLTMTSCSELGTQSRSRSLDSWNDRLSPCASSQFQPGEDEKASHKSSGNIGHKIKKSHVFNGYHSISDENKACFTDSSSDEDVIFEKDLETSNVSRLEYKHGPVTVQAQLHQYCNNANQFSESEWYETQEQSISFSNDPSGEMLGKSVPMCRMYNSDDEGGFIVSGSNRSISTRSQDHHKPQKCLVLPSIERVLKQSRPNSLNLTPHHQSEQGRELQAGSRGRWAERPSAHPGENTDRHIADHLSAGEWVERDHLSLPDSSRNDKIFMQADKNFQTIFSPIPEESPSDLTPLSPLKKRAGRSPQKFAQAGLSQDKDIPMEERNKQYRKKKRKHMREDRRWIDKEGKVSPTNSGSSTSHSSDCSECSYKNAIRNSSIVLPNVKTKKDVYVRNDNLSSSTSTSHHDNIQTTSSSSDDMSDNVTTPQITQHLQSKRTQNDSLKTQPPVMRKLSKDKERDKDKDGVNKLSEHLQDSKQRLFAKNSMGANRKSGSLKYKSDEASNSLLRYFRFPSPPRNGKEKLDNMEKDFRHGYHESKKAILKDQKQSIPEHLSVLRLEQQHGRHITYSNENRHDNAMEAYSTSTTDTASDIAYPGLKDRASLNITQVVNEKPLMSRGNRPPVQSQPQFASTPFEKKSKKAVDAVKLKNSPTFMYNHEPSYTLRVNEEKKKKEAKKAKCTIFERLFGRKRSEPIEQKELNKLSGEVRVKPPLSPLKRGCSYVLVPQNSFDNTESFNVNSIHDQESWPSLRYDKQRNMHRTHRRQPSYIVYNNDRRRPHHYYERSYFPAYHQDIPQKSWNYSQNYHPSTKISRSNDRRSQRYYHLQDLHKHHYQQPSRRDIFMLSRTMESRKIPALHYSDLKNSTIHSRVSSFRESSPGKKLMPKYPMAQKKVVQLL